MRLTRTAVVVAALCLFGCSAENGDVSEPTSTPESRAAASKQLNETVEGYFEESLELNPVFATFVGDHRFNDRFANSIGPEHIAKSKALEEKYLRKINEISPDDLEGQDLLTWDIFRRARENDIGGFKYPDELIPVSQFFSVPNFFALLGSSASVQPFATVEDYDNWIGRTDDFAIWIDQAIANMREGMEKGIVQPRVLMERTLPQLSAHVVDNVEESVFYGPISNIPEQFSDEDRERLTAAYREMIETTIVPTYAKLHDFIRDEYMPAARDTVGLSELPDGDEWYAYMVRTTTTTDLTPDEIHEIGLAEVERIHVQMREVMEEVEFEGDLKDFFVFLNTNEDFYFTEEEDLLNSYRAMREDLNKKAEKLFADFPEADFEIRAVEPFRARSASGASYQAASPDGSRPGVFYVNTYDLSARPSWAVESLFLHEAVPGHHFQISIQRELDDLPRFRRFGGYTAFAEGWGLYAESLGRELGVYQDPYQYYGALQAELWRALRLVVDTGLHSKGWTREDVLDYMYENTAVKEARAVSEAERFIAIPSQALAYKIGQLKIRELRDRAEEELGEDFDVKEFHALVLNDGALPLDVLEAKVDRYIADKKS